MKIARKISSVSFEEARKIETILNFLDPSLLNASLNQKISELRFDSLFFDETYFNELSSILNLNVKGIERYTNNLYDAFYFYTQDTLIHTSEILNKLNDAIREDEIKQKVKLEQWLDSDFATHYSLLDFGKNETLTGAGILEVESFKTYPHRVFCSLDDFGVSYSIGKTYYLSKPSVNFSTTILFDKPTTINTLLMPVCLPQVQYITSIEFKNDVGQCVYSVSDLEYFSNSYQLELILHPITITSIVIHFENTPATKSIVNVSEVELSDSINKTLSSISVHNAEKYITDLTQGEKELYELSVAIICYPMLRKYKLDTEIKIPLNYEGSLKAARCYWEAINFTNTGITSNNPETNVSFQLVTQQDGLVELNEIPNSKSFSNQHEKFILINQDLKYSLINHVPILNPEFFLRTTSQGDVKIGAIRNQNYLQISTPVNQSLVMKYSFDDNFNIKYPVIVDRFGSLLFKERKYVTNLFINIRLSRVHNNPFLTPVLRYAVCGVVR